MISIIDAGNNMIVANAVSLEGSQLGAFDVERRDALAQKNRDVLGDSPVQRSQVHLGLVADLNPPNQDRALLRQACRCGCAYEKVNQALLCKVPIFEVVQVLKDGFAGIERFQRAVEWQARFGSCSETT
jgi:hypothetical protein